MVGRVLWFACEHPEKEPDPFVTWHYSGCAACRFKAEVQAQRFPDDTHVAWLVGFIEPAEAES